MNWTHAKPRLRLLALAVLAVSLTVLIWGFFSRDQGQPRFDLVNVEPVGNDYDVTLRLTNDSNRHLNTFGLYPDFVSMIGLRDRDSASVFIAYQYVVAGGVVNLTTATYTTWTIPPGESEDITVRMTSYDVENRHIIPSISNFRGTPWWAKIYFLFPEGKRPKSLERKINQRLNDIQTFEGEGFRAADWLEATSQGVP